MLTQSSLKRKYRMQATTTPCSNHYMSMNASLERQRAIGDATYIPVGMSTLVLRLGEHFHPNMQRRGKQEERQVTLPAGPQIQCSSVGIKFVIRSRINLSKLPWTLCVHLLPGLAAANFSSWLVVIYFSLRLTRLRKLLILDRLFLSLPYLPQKESEKPHTRYAKRNPSPISRAKVCLSPLTLESLGWLVTVTDALSMGEATCVALTIAKGGEVAENAEALEVIVWLDVSVDVIDAELVNAGRCMTLPTSAEGQVMKLAR